MDSELFSRILLYGTLLICICYELFQYFRGRASENWQPWVAKVVGTGTRTFRSDVGSDESKPTIKYTYRYGGVRYTGRRVKYGNLWRERLTPPKVDLHGISGGDELEIFVNPDQPGQSVLFRGYEGDVYKTVGPLVAVLITLYFLI